MGLLFVILFHFIAIFVLSCVVGLIAIIITYFLSKSEKKKRKLLFAFFAPFIGFYSLYILAFAGSIFVSELKNVDIGIGDAWYVPVKDDYEILFIDVPETAFIAKHESGQIFVSDITDIVQKDNMIFGKRSPQEFFSFNTITEEIEEFDNEKALFKSANNKKLRFVKVFDFYTQKRNEIAGFWFIIVGIISLLVSVSILYVIRKIFFINFRSK